MKGYLHKISTVRSGKDDKMENITNRQENYLTQLVVSMLDGKRQSRAKMLKDKRLKHLQKEMKVQEKWKTYGHYKKLVLKRQSQQEKEKEIQRKSHKLMNKELISVGYMIGSNVAF